MARSTRPLASGSAGRHSLTATTSTPRNACIDADNATWWSGAVLAHGETDELAWRIDAAERFYAERNAVARFQVCAGCPDALDQALAERRYRWEAPVSLLTRALRTQTEPTPTRGTTVRVDASLSRDWLAVLSATSKPGTDVEYETRLLRRVNRPQSYVTVHVGDEPVGIGRAVADGDWTGVFSMATIPEMRCCLPPLRDIRI